MYYLAGIKLSGMEVYYLASIKLNGLAMHYLVSMKLVGLEWHCTDSTRLDRKAKMKWIKKILLYKLAKIAGEFRRSAVLSWFGDCFVVWIQHLLYWSMLLDLVIGAGSVGDVLSYVTGEVPGETGSLGQNWITAQSVAILMKFCGEVVLTPETIMKLCKAVKLKIAFEGETELLTTFPN